MIPFTGQTKDLQAVASGAAPVPGTCPLCGRKTNPANGCRRARLGYWCQRGILVEDRSSWLTPTPDPAHVKVATDPELAAAQDAEDAAQTCYNAADRAHAGKAAELAEVRTAARRVPVLVILHPGARRPFQLDPKIDKLRAAERRLVPEVERLAALRDLEGETLVRARVEVNRASERARAGLAAQFQHEAPGRHQIPECPDLD